jgi:hypothetical protein
MDVRNAICLALEQQGVEVEVHHHEVAAAGQCEIGTRFAPLVQRADWMQILKYTVWNVAASYGKTATFMPKPVVGDNGSGMHVHQSVWKGSQNQFAGNGYSGLSEFALYYIGGIIKHARALNAITNPGTNSYKRLVPGFEAPINLAYSAKNRSASCRIPYVSNPKARRVEVRFPDPTANSYLAFAAMLMAGLDGVQSKIHPGDPIDKNLYDLPPEEAKKVPTVCHSLDQALAELDKDRAFLTKGGVFSDDFLDSYVALKEEEVTRFRMTTHPVVFDMYYSSLNSNNLARWRGDGLARPRVVSGMFLIVRRFLPYLLCALAVAPAPALSQDAQEATIWSCRDKDGRTHVTNLREDTLGKDCRVIRQTRVQVVPTPSRGAKPATPPTTFPKEDSQSRASARERQREILERELAQEEKLLGEARKALEEQEGVRYGDERNYARVLERLQKYKDAVDVHEKNIESLRRELTNLYR